MTLSKPQHCYGDGAFKHNKWILMCRKSARVPIYPSRINCAFQVQEGAVQLCLVLLSVKMDFVLYPLHRDKFYPISFVVALFSFDMPFSEMFSVF